jgi:CBS domain-containing protein
MRVENWMTRDVSAAREAMDREAVTIGPTDSLRRAAERMTANQTEELVVVGDGGKPLGILRESDVVRAVAQGDLVPVSPLDADWLSHVRVSDLMTPDPRTIDIDSDLEEAVGLILEGDFRHLPVLDADQRLAGMLSERDLRGALGANLRDWSSLEENRFDEVIANVMVPGAVFVRAENRLVDILDVFTDERIGAVPVLDENDVLVGILSYVDILRWMQAQAKEAGLELVRVAEAVESL